MDEIIAYIAGILDKGHGYITNDGIIIMNIIHCNIFNLISMQVSISMLQSAMTMVNLVIYPQAVKMTITAAINRSIIRKTKEILPCGRLVRIMSLLGTAHGG